MSEGPVTVACKTCKNKCRLVISDVVTVQVYGGVFDTYNLWQCDECGSMFRELSGHKRLDGNRLVDAVL